MRVLSRQKRQGSAGVTYLQGDVTDRASVAAACDGVDVVYDLSMAFGETWNDYLKSFVQGAENVAEVVMERGIRRLIYTSTIAGLHLARAAPSAKRTGPSEARAAQLVRARQDHGGAEPQQASP